MDYSAVVSYRKIYHFKAGTLAKLNFFTVPLLRSYSRDTVLEINKAKWNHNLTQYYVCIYKKI